MQHQSSGLSLAANEIVIYEIILLHNKGHFNLELLDISFTSHLANITLGREFANAMHQQMSILVSHYGRPLQNH